MDDLLAEDPTDLCARHKEILGNSVRSRSGLSVALRDDRWPRPSREIRRSGGRSQLAKMPSESHPNGRSAPCYRWRALRLKSQGDRGGMRREDPPPLLADLDCAVRRSGPVSASVSSSVSGSPSGRGVMRHEPRSLRMGAFGRRSGTAEIVRAWAKVPRSADFGPAPRWRAGICSRGRR